MIFKKHSIFILEDDPARNELFMKNLSLRYSVVLTNSSDFALEVLKQIKFSLILLDHDLGGRQMVGSGEYDTGFRVAAGIPTTCNKDSSVIIHSYNPTGAQKMFDVLSTKNKVLIPFGRPYFWTAIHGEVKSK